MGELEAAGVTDAALRASYLTCRRLNATHGRTYFLATRLLPAAKRPAVHALYGFARYADELVDDLASARTSAEKASALSAFADEFRAGRPGNPIVPALRDTQARYRIPTELFEAFLASMAQDLTVTEYATHEDLAGYTYGSAEVIGLMMLPVLGHPGVPAAVVGPYARDLGRAFQLANFIRDVGEDLRRGRIYLPAQDLAAFGVTRELLAGGVVDGRLRRLLAHEIAYTRELFRRAQPGIRLLAASSRPCVRTAFTLYAQILTAVERADYQVLDRRVSVGPGRRLAVAGPALLQAWRTRRRRPAGG